MMELKKKKKDHKFIPILIIIIALVGAGLLLYKPVMTKLIIPKMHDHVSQAALKTPPSQYKHNQKNADQLFKDYYKKHHLKYDPKNFSQQAAKNAAYRGLGGDSSSSSTKSKEGKHHFGSSSGHKGAPDISYDYSKTGNFAGNTDLSTINPKYDKRLLTGHIAMPAVGINLPILQGVGGNNLFVGACTLKPLQKMGQGNYALASHHMPDEYSDFSKLGQLRKGNMILLSSGRRVYEYRVTSVRGYPTASGQVLDDENGKKQVTLVTCMTTYGGNVNGNTRIVVKGNLKGVHGFNSRYGQYFKR